MVHEVPPAFELASAHADGRAEDVVVDQCSAADAVALHLGVEMPASVRADLLGLALAGLGLPFDGDVFHVVLLFALEVGGYPLEHDRGEDCADGVAPEVRDVEAPAEEPSREGDDGERDGSRGQLHEQVSPVCAEPLLRNLVIAHEVLLFELQQIAVADGLEGSGEGVVGLLEHQTLALVAPVGRALGELQHGVHGGQFGEDVHRGCDDLDVGQPEAGAQLPALGRAEVAPVGDVPDAEHAELPFGQQVAVAVHAGADQFALDGDFASKGGEFALDAVLGGCLPPDVGLVALKLEVAAAHAERPAGRMDGAQNTVIEEPSAFSVTSQRTPLRVSGQSARFWMRSSSILGIQEGKLPSLRPNPCGRLVSSVAFISASMSS